MTAIRKVLVVASTFPAHASDPVPAFVRDQIIAIKQLYPELTFTVLAPHDPRSGTVSFTQHQHYEEYRFRYFFPRSAEKLAGRGIMPALKANPLNYLLIPFLFVGELWALHRLVHKTKPDIIYAHWFTPQAITASIVSKLSKTRFVFTTHAADVAVWHKIPLIGKSIVRRTTLNATAITAVSQRSMAKLQGFFTHEQWSELATKTKIIPMGVDLPQNPSRDLPPTKDILFVGRLAEKKGIQYLLPAYKSVQDQLGDSRLIIAGDGPWLAILKKQVIELGLEGSVSFPGFVTGREKAELIQSAHTYVVPSIITDSGDAEGLPVSLMEGLAYGKVCIATNESGADGIITSGVDGYLLPHKDSAQLAKLLITATSLSDDEYLAVSQAATATAQQFAWSQIARQHIDFLFNKEVRV